MKRKILGIILLLALLLCVYAIYDNLSLMHSILSPEIILIIAFILPIPLFISEFVFMGLGQLIMGRYSRDGTEFGVGMAYLLSICATFAIMANLFISLPDLVFSSISEPLLVVLLALLPILATLWFQASTPRTMDEHGVIDEKKLKPDTRPYSILTFFVLLAACLIVWASSTDFITYVFGTVMVFMGFTLVFPLMFYPIMTYNYLLYDESGPAFSGIEMYLIFLLHPIAVIAGAIVGSLVFFGASLL